MSIEKSIRITHPTGLHARPAVKLTQLAASFNAAVQLRLDGSDEWIKAKSVAKVMKLKAAANATLHFRAEGEQAAEAVAALVDFVKRDFDEGPALPQTSMENEESCARMKPPPAPTLTASEVETVITALTAAEGLADGFLYPLLSDSVKQRAKGSIEQEKALFQEAVERTIEQLDGLTRNAGSLAVDIIAFQKQLLADDELLAPVTRSIDNGAGAHEAWCQVLDAEISEYLDASDEYFRGRATDLRDLRDRVLALLSGRKTVSVQAPEGAILVADELTPSQFLEIDWQRYAGAVTRFGTQTGHVAMLARANNVPLLIQSQVDPAKLPPRAEAILIAERGNGRLVLNPSNDTRIGYGQRQQQRQRLAEAARHYLPQPGRTADGSPITVYLNVDDPAVLQKVDPSHCDGIGLTRTEFLFYDKAGLPDEETQYQTYRRLLEWAQGRPVCIRTLDAGGDKPIPGLTPIGEGNPFLGVRGLRLSLKKPEVFQVQLRALARAAAHGPLKVMAPMVTLPQELAQTRSLFQQVVGELNQSGIAAAMPSLGMMVEVPAAALTIAHFKADFLSIGSNDLIQYVMAAGRDCPGVADLQDPKHPAVLELIGRVVEHGAKTGIEVSICGEMAAMPEYLQALIDIGINTLSVPPAALGMTKVELAQVERRI